MFAAQRPAAQRPTAWQALVVALECRVITHLQAASMDAMSKSHRGVVLPPTIDDLSLSIFIILYPYYHAVPYYMVQHDRDKNKFSTTPSNGSTGSTKSGMQLSRP
jgi:hypothetical protein